MADTIARAGIARAAVLTAAGGQAGVAARRPTGFVAIGVHGGAGVSTLVRLLDPARSGLVVEWRTGMALVADRVPLLVARSTASGVAAAAGWVTRWRPDLARPALVLVADVPFRTPQIVRYRVRALSSQVSAVVEVPWLFRLRYLDDPAEVLADRKAARAVKSVHRQLTELSGGL